MLAQQKIRLLSDESILRNSEEADTPFRRKRTCFGLSRAALITHFIFATLYLAITAVLITQFRARDRKLSIQAPFYSPAEESIEWELQDFDVDVGHTSPYTGPPSYDIDVAWHNLFKYSNIRVTEEELRKLNRTSIQLADGNGYMANLDVHHQLHCVKYLRYYVYPEYYKEELAEKGTRHADHCIENLRRNIMCTPSLALLTLNWKSDREMPQPHFSYQHTCMNWDRIDTWVRDRSFDIFDKSLLVNPIFDPELAKNASEE